MRVSILHLSDLHRDPANPIRNDALLQSLENDRARYTLKEEAKIRSPDVIVVSGDIIQGVSPGTADPDTKLDAQHSEALHFLNRLTERLVGGDRNRVVIVPGNHDVSACHFMDSVQRVEIVADRKKVLVSEFFSSSSLLRWSWADFELFKIVDEGKYARRLETFAAFYGEFYRGLRIYSLDPSKQFDIFDFPEFNLTIVGFSSCHNNDIFNKQGAIHPGCIGDAGIRLRDPQFNDRLRIAVWHHNTEGLPMQFDYMDPDILQNLIDSGFSVGLHGHQHRPQFLDTRFRYGGDRRITVISAGTLCGSASFRFGRAYNVIELDTETRDGRLHLREMQNDNLQLPIWGRRSPPPESKTFLQFSFDAPPEPLARADPPTSTLLRAQDFYNQGEYRKAADTLVDLAATDELARRLLLDCLDKLGDTRGIVTQFDPPVSPTEAINLMDALWKEGEREQLGRLLARPVIAASTDPSVIELRQKYLAKLKR